MAYVDVPAAIIRLIKEFPKLVDEFGDRICAMDSYPDKGYDPSDGAALVFNIRGGVRDCYDNVSVQFKIYPKHEKGVDQAQEAWRLWELLYDCFCEVDCWCPICGVELEAGTYPSFTQESEADTKPAWCYMLVFFRFCITRGVDWKCGDPFPCYKKESEK